MTIERCVSYFSRATTKNKKVKNPIETVKENHKNALLMQKKAEKWGRGGKRANGQLENKKTVNTIPTNNYIKCKQTKNSS